MSGLAVSSSKLKAPVVSDSSAVMGNIGLLSSVVAAAAALPPTNLISPKKVDPCLWEQELESIAERFKEESTVTNLRMKQLMEEAKVLRAEDSCHHDIQEVKRLANLELPAFRQLKSLQKHAANFLMHMNAEVKRREEELGAIYAKIGSLRGPPLPTGKTFGFYLDQQLNQEANPEDEYLLIDPSTNDIEDALTPIIEAGFTVTLRNELFDKLKDADASKTPASATKATEESKE